MLILVAFVALVLGNVLVAGWAVNQIPELSMKIAYGIPLYLYLPVGAFYYICRFDEFSRKLPEDHLRETLFFVLPVVYFLLFLVFVGAKPKGLQTVFILPIIVGLPIADACLLVLTAVSVTHIFSFYRVMVGMGVPRHPAHDVITSDRVIEPSEAAVLARSIEQAMNESLGYSKLQLDIRNSRCNKLLALLRKKVDYLAQQNKQREAERLAEIERISRPERERLEALRRALQLDADLEDSMVELIRENERRKRTGA